jgi:ribosomal protein S16
MAVRIRMKMVGRRHRPFFRICAMDARSPRDGRAIEELGTYDPLILDLNHRVTLKADRIAYWLSVGAQPTCKVSTLIEKYACVVPSKGQSIMVNDTGVKSVATAHDVDITIHWESLSKSEDRIRFSAQVHVPYRSSKGAETKCDKNITTSWVVNHDATGTTLSRNSFQLIIPLLKQSEEVDLIVSMPKPGMTIQFFGYRIYRLRETKTASRLFRLASIKRPEGDFLRLKRRVGVMEELHAPCPVT